MGSDVMQSHRWRLERGHAATWPRHPNGQTAAVSLRRRSLTPWGQLSGASSPEPRGDRLLAGLPRGGAWRSGFCMQITEQPHVAFPRW